MTSKVKFTYAHLGEAFRQNRAIFELGLASVTVLLLLFLASRIPDRRVQAAGIDMRLTRAISSPYPFDANSIGEITTIFRWATADRVSISPRLVNVAGKRVVEASRENPSAWPAALAVMDYRSTLIKETSLPKRAVCFDVGNAIGINASVLNSFLGNCTQELDHIAWENVVFENATVVYHGGPAILENVQFKNCQFSVDYTPAGQELAKALTASESVTITLPSR